MSETGTVGLLEPYEFLLEDFEFEKSLEQFSGATAKLSGDWFTRRRNSVRVAFRAGGGWVSWNAKPHGYDEWPNFAEYEYFHVDMWNPADHPAPRPGDNSHGLAFSNARGPCSDNIEARLQPHQVRHLKIDIQQRLGNHSGAPVDVSTISHFNFYAWNPSIDYVRHFDNIRLTRDLSRHFRELSATMELLERVGMESKMASRLRKRIYSEWHRLEKLPFSVENFANARQIIAGLKAEIAQEDIFLPRV